jgi:C1A family cysteine protease
MKTPPSGSTKPLLLRFACLLALVALAFGPPLGASASIPAGDPAPAPQQPGPWAPASPGSPYGLRLPGAAPAALGADQLVPNLERQYPAAASLPARFDWRVTGKVSPVKDQGACGACTAFASIAALESRLLIDGAGLWDFSENNAKECDWYQTGCAEGYSWKVFSFFGQKGAVLESCDPYVPSDVACNSSCAYQKSVLEWRVLKGAGQIPDTNWLKQILYEYGPIQASLFTGTSGAWDTEFNNYNGTYTLYYNGTEKTNHAVLIVGWDDTLTHAGGTGGWIVKNSWGTGWGGPCGYGTQGGFFTIAYGSASIGSDSSMPVLWQDYDPQGSVWYYDEAAPAAFRGYGSTTAWEMAKFIPPTNTYVTRVEFWTDDYAPDVDVYLYDGFDGTNLSGLLATKLNLQIPNTGLYSVPLDTPVPVTAGNDVIAVLKITNGAYDKPIPVDARGPHETGRTYISADGVTWEDLGATYGVDGTIRLRTKLNPPLPTKKYTYLPLVVRSNPTPVVQGINGLVTTSAAPAAGINLRLIFYNGSAWVEKATTTTGADGRYAFVGMPSLAAGQGYYVFFGYNTTTPSYLYYWAGPTLTSYTAGTALAGGNFDIANVSLLSPSPGATRTLPTTFTWQRRGLSGDTYRLILFDPESTDWWLTNDLGDVGSATMTSLPDGAEYDKTYGWLVRVYRGGDSYGNSYYYREITFSSDAAGSQNAQTGENPVVLQRGVQDDSRADSPLGVRGGGSGTLEGNQAP